MIETAPPRRLAETPTQPRRGEGADVALAHGAADAATAARVREHLKAAGLQAKLVRLGAFTAGRPSPAQALAILVGRDRGGLAGSIPLPHDGEPIPVMVVVDGAADRFDYELAPARWVDLRGRIDDEGAIRSLVTALHGRGPVWDHGPVSESVRAVLDAATESLTAFELARRLMARRPGYAGGRAADPPVGEAPPRARRLQAGAWLMEVRRLYDRGALDFLSLRRTVSGLTTLEPELGRRLRADGFMGALMEGARRAPLTAYGRGFATAASPVSFVRDRPASEDVLDRQLIADALAEQLRDVLWTESGGERRLAGGSFIVNLHGPWGSGKSTLLGYVRDGLRAQRPDPWVVTEFNAWQHERVDPPWWWVMNAVYRAGIAASGDLPPHRRLAARARLLLWRHWTAALAGALIAAVTSLAALAVAAGWFDTLTGAIPSTVGLVSVVAGVGTALRRWVVVGSTREADARAVHVDDPMGRVVRRFRRLVEEVIGRPVAILVDDLDRCRPETVVAFIDGIQSLFADVPAVWVIAADRSWLHESYALRFASLEGLKQEPGRPLGYLFLQKMFQLSFDVPPISEADRERLWRGILNLPSEDPGELETRRQVQASVEREIVEHSGEDDLVAYVRDQEADPRRHLASRRAAVRRLSSQEERRRTEHVLERFAPLLHDNPRAMKRIVNAYVVLRATWLLTAPALHEDDLPRLALWTILSRSWPSLAERLADRPELIDVLRDRDTDPEAFGDLAPLVRDPIVRRVLDGDAPTVDVRLTPDAIRAFLFLPPKTAVAETEVA